MKRRDFLWALMGVHGAVVFDESFAVGRIDAATVDLLVARTAILRVRATETVDPIIASLESHAGLLSALLRDAPREYRTTIGRMAAETAWLAANAHSDNSDDERSLRWGVLAARAAGAVGDHDLRAHALSRISRTYLSLRDPSRGIHALRRVDLAQVSSYGRARIEVHRALAVARLETQPQGARFTRAMYALDEATEALLDSVREPRPSWVWWTNDAGFLLSWRAEVLRSLDVAEQAASAFRAAATATAVEDNRELPFLQAGLAEVIARRGDVDEAVDEAIRAIMLGRAIGADAALGRIRSVYRTLVELAPDSHHVRSLRDALRS